MSHVALLWHIVAHEVDKVSSLSVYEFVNLVGHFHDLASGKPSKDSSLNNRGYSPEILEQINKEREKTFSPISSLGLRFTKPLHHFKSDILVYSLTLFENYERGVMPFPGSTSEQPAQVMEIFGVLQSLRLERQEIERKKLERQNVRNKHQGQHRATR